MVLDPPDDGVDDIPGEHCSCAGDICEPGESTMPNTDRADRVVVRKDVSDEEYDCFRFSTSHAVPMFKWRTSKFRRKRQ